ncbi:autophagy-related protein 13 isoform X1, partial [Tachysurus ichikawai]
QFERTGPIMGIIIDHFVERPLGNTALMHPCNYRAPGEEEGGVYAGVEDSQEVCTTSFSTSPPSQCLCTVSQAHCKSPKPALTATLKVPVMGLGFSQQLCTSRLSYQTPLLGPVDLCHPTAYTAAAHPHQIAAPGKEGGVPQVLVQPSHGTQADHGRVPSCPSADIPHPPPSNCSSEGKSTSPSDVPQTTFTRKVGAFVNKPTTQVTTASLDLPFAAFAPRGYDLEENDPMVQTRTRSWPCDQQSVNITNSKLNIRLLLHQLSQFGIWSQKDGMVLSHLFFLFTSLLVKTKVGTVLSLGPFGD